MTETHALKASKLFKERCQRPQEKPVDFASELKKLFKQAFPEEDTKFAVLLQRFLTGLQPQISCQILLCKKPDSFEQAIADAVEVQEAFSYNPSLGEDKPSPNAVNAVSTGSETKPSQAQESKWFAGPDKCTFCSGFGGRGFCSGLSGGGGALW